MVVPSTFTSTGGALDTKWPKRSQPFPAGVAADTAAPAGKVVKATQDNTAPARMAKRATLLGDLWNIGKGDFGISLSDLVTAARSLPRTVEVSSTIEVSPGRGCSPHRFTRS